VALARGRKSGGGDVPVLIDPKAEDYSRYRGCLAITPNQCEAEIAARMTFVIGPAEELFWRGLVQRMASDLHGRWAGAALTAAAYAGAHAVTKNLTLTGAAGVAGTYWSALTAAGVPMGALIASHIAWDIWIFLVAPTHPTGPRA